MELVFTSRNIALSLAPGILPGERATIATAGVAAKAMADECITGKVLSYIQTLCVLFGGTCKGTRSCYQNTEKCFPPSCAGGPTRKPPEPCAPSVPECEKDSATKCMPDSPTDDCYKKITKCNECTHKRTRCYCTDKLSEDCFDASCNDSAFWCNLCNPENPSKDDFSCKKGENTNGCGATMDPCTRYCTNAKTKEPEPKPASPGEAMPKPQEQQAMAQMNQLRDALRNTLAQRGGQA